MPYFTCGKCGKGFTYKNGGIPCGYCGKDSFCFACVNDHSCVRLTAVQKLKIEHEQEIASIKAQFAREKAQWQAAPPPPFGKEAGSPDPLVQALHKIFMGLPKTNRSGLYRALSKPLHPDQGGTHALMVALNNTKDRLTKDKEI
jgi:hypothetical protein